MTLYDYKIIPNFSDYVIARSGVVYSFRRGAKKILKNRIDSHGYPYVTLCNEEGQKNFRVHRLKAQAFIPNPSDLKFINHKNGIKADLRDENLEWVTASQNIQHAFDTGLSRIGNRKGEANNAAKLNREAVIRIRQEYKPRAPGVTADLASRFGVSQNLIRRVASRSLWRHV